MKKNLSLVAKTLVALAAIAIVATSAYAWTAPTPGTIPPNGNVPAPVNTGNVPQTKNADFSVMGNLWAKVSGTTGGSVFGTRGFFSNLVNSSKARFGCFLSCDNDTTADIFIAGRYDGGIFGKGLAVNLDGLVMTKNSPIWIGLGGNTGSAGRNGLAIFVNQDNVTGTAGAVLQTNADKFSFFDTTDPGRLVGITAKKIQLPEGAAAGKVLTSSDAIGNAVWADAASAVSSTSTTTDGLIYTKRADGGDIVRVYCEAGDMVIGGGAACSYGTQRSAPMNGAGNIVSYTDISNGDPIGWYVDCNQRTNDPLGSAGGVVRWNGGDADGSAQAYAICMKKTSLITDISTDGNSGGGGGGGDTTTPPPVVSWKSVPPNVPDGTAGQTCSQWMSTAANVPSTFVQDIANIGTEGGVLGGSSTNPANRSCAQRVLVGGTTYCGVGSFAVQGVQSNPVKVCSGSSINYNGSVGAPVTIKTYIRY